MCLFLLLLVFVASQGPAPTPSEVGKPEQQQPSISQRQAGSDSRGTEQSPLVVKMTPSIETPEETARDAKEREEKSANDRHVIYLTGALALIAFLQLLVYFYQSIKLRETVESAKGQSEAMERHVGEASRSAKAMENVVAVINYGNHAAFRACLSVIIGSAIYQQRKADRQSPGDVKFEGKPTLVNTGNTPARNVVIRTAAEILPIPVPTDFSYPVPEDPDRKVGMVGPHHQYILSATVKDFAPDGEVGEIKRGETKALLIWGTITYDDMFGGHHTTKFGQGLTWWPNGTVFGYYIDGQNDAD